MSYSIYDPHDIFRLLTKGQLSLYYLLLFKMYPELIGYFERYLKLPVTNDLNEMYRNFSRRYWATHFTIWNNDPNESLGLASAYGKMIYIEICISRGANDWNHGMYGAAKSGNLELVEYFIQKGANNWNWGMRGAAESGNLEIVKYLITKGSTEGDAYTISCVANNLNFCMFGAIKSGHLELVEYFIKKGATSTIYCIKLAKLNGHYHIVEYLSSL